jgi:hypothetical protein
LSSAGDGRDHRRTSFALVEVIVADAIAESIEPAQKTGGVPPGAEALAAGTESFHGGQTFRATVPGGCLYQPGSS